MGKGESSIPDEEWERFLRDAEAGVPGAPEEPSARARMVTQRPAAESGPPTGWRTHRPPSRQKGQVRYFVGFFVAIALLLVSLNPGWVTGWFGGGGGAGDTAPLAAESVRPARPPATEPAVELPTLDEPFRGSPAARWGDGVAALALPEARATGWMSKAQVAQALERSRDFLAASGLDHRVLRGERPSSAIALLNPHQKDIQQYVTTALRTPSAENDPLRLFSRFAPSKVRVVGDVVKTRGRITYREGKRGAVEVATDVTYVYPVVRAAGSDEVTRTIVRREIVMSWDDPAKIIIEPGTFSLASYRSSTANSGCGNHTGYFAPEFAADRAVNDEKHDGVVADPYDRSVSMDALLPENGDKKCGTATRL
ncbi:hypothetical protein ACIOEW_13330 [Streptomyces sp. NPDC087901]|uniref:hypothetical protein n=1 Tax=Streptomyces sp. NPDC087901 TaxID=3365818 RepID=UPI0038253006